MKINSVEMKQNSILLHWPEMGSEPKALPAGAEARRVPDSRVLGDKIRPQAVWGHWPQTVPWEAWWQGGHTPPSPL